MLPFRDAAGKEARMARYFMSGTKYEAFERMMMDPDRRPEPDGPDEEKNSYKEPNAKKERKCKNAV